ncbi:MAG TPA: glycosyltransferase family 2 protein [Bryobacteraceae bacterium]|nr:glycosyltransferase family 2 protein [Bryobacteraceae bacterium]
MNISVIVPVWNGEDLLRRLLASLRAQTLGAAEWLVVDNGSEDGAPEVARQAGARVIPMGRNAGFAAAVNRGIREARGELAAVLNSDVELSPGYLASLAQAMDDTGAWFATGEILAEGSGALIDGAFDAVCRGGTACRVGHGQADGPAFRERRQIWSAPWTAALFRAELFQRTGGLEESFESYLEDVDFGLRCARLGLPGLYVPEAVAWHRGSASLGRWHPETVRRIARNQVFLLARHFPKRALRRHAWAILVAQALWGALALRHGAGVAWARGKWQGWRGFATARGSELFEPAALNELLDRNERLIREAQGPGVQDCYWRVYFLLTASGAK